MTLDFLSLRQFHFWRFFAPFIPSALPRAVLIYPLGLPGITFQGAAVGLDPLLPEGQELLLQIHPPFL